MRIIPHVVILISLGVYPIGCGADRGPVKVLFTSDVKGRLWPAG